MTNLLASVVLLSLILSGCSQSLPYYLAIGTIYPPSSNAGSSELIDLAYLNNFVGHQWKRL